MTTPRHRILYVESNEDHTVGGSYQALFDLVGGLDPTRYEPLVLFYQDNIFGERLRERDVTVLSFEPERRSERLAYAATGPWSKIAARYAAIRRRAALIGSLDVDLVHLNDSPQVGHTTWLPAARLKRVPCVVTAMARVSRSVPWHQRFLSRNFDRIIPISHSVQRTLEDLGYPPQKLQTVHLGIDPEGQRGRVTRSRDDIRGELQLGPDTVVAAMVGNLRHWKGQHVVLEALRMLPRATLERLHVLFIGAATPEDKEYEASLHRQVADAHLEAHVSFLGVRQDVPDLVHASDIAVHASVTPEPFGLVVPEAMALGRPVITAATGGPAEVVTESSGLTFDPEHPLELAEHLTTLANDEQRRVAMGKAAQERAEAFTVTQMVAGNERVYQSLLAREPKR